jgi:rhodanese-related sulfurtransferase
MRFFVTVLFLIMLGSSVSAFATDIETVDKDELKPMLGTADLVIIDVRAGRDWSSSEFKIKGAVREDPGDVEAWAGNYEKGKTIVLYCA